MCAYAVNKLRILQALAPKILRFAEQMMVFLLAFSQIMVILVHNWDFFWQVLFNDASTKLPTFIYTWNLW